MKSKQNCLLISFVCFVISLCMILVACANSPDVTKQPLCRHKAMMQALNWGEVAPTRIAIGKLNGTPHAEAQVKWDDEWWYVWGNQLAKKPDGFKFDHSEQVSLYFCRLLQTEVELNQ